MNPKQILNCLLLLIALMATTALSAQFGNTPCTAIDLMVLNPDPTVSVVESRSNDGYGNDPFALPDCGSQFNTLYYRFALPTGYTHVQITYTPLDGQAGEISLFDQNLCGSPTFGTFLGLDACGIPGEVLVINNEGTGICLPNGGPVILKVSGAFSGNFILEIHAIPPSCFDGCKNGFELGIDSIGPIDIISTSGDSSLCLGDVIGLTVPAIPPGSNFFWSTGETTPSIAVSSPDIYLVQIQLPDGCVVMGEIEITVDDDCVWPGEVNKDLIVDAKDLLPIGIAYGVMGTPRLTSAIALDWQPQRADDFDRDFRGFLTGVNTKHADCNGDGIINAMDAIAIDSNYGEQPLFRTSETPAARGSMADPPLFIEFSSDSVEVGDTLIGTVYLGDSAHIVANLYGYSLDLQLPFAFLDTNYFSIDYSNSWLDDDTTLKLSFTKVNVMGGYVDLSYTRTDSTERTGHGELFSFKVVVEDNLDGRLTKERSLHFDYSDVLANTVNPDSIGIFLREDSVLASEFCDSKGLDSSDEWIDGFIVGGKIVFSGNNGGYREVTVTTGHLKTGNNYTFFFKPGFSGAKHDMHWRMWIDLNLDGDLDDVGEMLMDVVSDTIHSHIVSIPITAALGWTTLRIQAKDYDGIAPEACEDFAEGEVEDYIVEMKATVSRTYQEQPSQQMQLYPNPSHGVVHIGLDQLPAEEMRLRVYDLQGKLLWDLGGLEASQSLKVDLGGLPNGMYVLELSAANWKDRKPLSLIR